EWENAIDSLVTLEAAFKFKDSRKSISTTSRPDAVGAWIKSARKDSLPKEIKGTEPMTFGNAVLEWWNAAQPEWRGLMEEDLTEGGWPREVRGQWGKLRCPGVNGMYSIIACMRWWGMLSCQAEKTPSNLWKMALEDMVWVMDTMAAGEEEPPTKKPR
ncbi:hypothetical protein K435DRAFT_586568, partial [Dendrothele bispora CBS 962.96]